MRVRPEMQQTFPDRKLNDAVSLVTKALVTLARTSTNGASSIMFTCWTSLRSR
jgi:hypothetical protein